MRILVNPAPPEVSEEILLFNGENLKDWNFHAPRNRPSKLHECWAVDSDRKVLLCLGNGFNWIETKSEFRDFTTSFDWRFPLGKTITPSGCGFVVRSVEGDNPNSLIPVGIEAQIGNGTSGDLWSIGTNLVSDRPSPERGGLFLRISTSEKPIGEWNTMEVSCKEDQITVSLNGTVVNDGKELAKRAGRICLLSQNSQVEFRNIRLVKY